MTPPLFWLDPLPDGSPVLLDGAEGRHAARVRRVRPGEPVLLGDGRGTLLTCLCRQVDGERLVLDVTARRVQAPPDPRLVVVQALPKSDRAELAVELLTELGADEIVPWAAARSIGQWRERSAEKWARTAAEAAKQSRRAFVPVIGAPATTAALSGRLRDAFAVVLHEDADDRIGALAVPPAGDVVLVVGPEGGVAPDELAAFVAAGARPVRLGAPVLRTSTAGAAGLAALSLLTGRF